MLFLFSMHVEKKHTPLIIDPGKRLKEANKLSWNPYRAGDEAADLALPQEEVSDHHGKMTSHKWLIHNWSLLTCS